MILPSILPCTSFLLIVHCLGYMPCPQSVPTVSYVSRCPCNAVEWRSAAAKKDCETLAMHQNCTENKNFVYHCVLNQEATELVEVCAPIWYMSGYCARFSIADKKLINDPGLDCSGFDPPCPSRFPSNESYKYQMCYNNVLEDSTSTYHEKRDTDNSLTVPLLATFGIITICLLILLFVRFESKWKKQIVPSDGFKNSIAESDHESRTSQRDETHGDEIKEKVETVDVGVQTDTTEEDEGVEFVSLSRKIREKYPLKDVRMIGDLREKLSKRLRVSMDCLWIVDQENGTVYHDDTKVESSKIKRYSLMIGNMHRTKEFDENEDGNVETDVINNRHITKGKIRMRCGHFTVSETLFDWIRETLPGHTDKELHCPKCKGSWDIEEVLEKCNLSEDEDIFFRRVWETCKATGKYILMENRGLRRHRDIFGLENITRSLDFIPHRSSTFEL
ncbi:uncharacterized protein LOC111137276 isoform X2 [Crassostrea virginica]